MLNRVCLKSESSGPHLKHEISLSTCMLFLRTSRECFSLLIILHDMFRETKLVLCYQLQEVTASAVDMEAASVVVSVEVTFTLSQ